jgi:hypothetical protein
MRSIITACMLFLLFTIISCGKNSAKHEIEKLKSEITDYKEADGIAGSIADTTIIGEPAPPPDTEQKKEQVPAKPVPNPDWDKKIIKTASLSVEVKDYNAFYSNLREKVRNLGGYIAQEDQQQTDYKLENILVIKVPVDQFDNAVSQFSSNVEKVNEKKISSNDVTAEYVDTRSRIEAKKQVRNRYMDLLKEAKNMEEILNVQSEINSIQEEIESATGRIQYLGQSAAYSTINLTYYQVINASAKVETDPNFGSKLNAAFRSGWNWVGDLFVGLVTIWPLFFLILIAVVLYKRTKTVKPKEA